MFCVVRAVRNSELRLDLNEEKSGKLQNAVIETYVFGRIYTSYKNFDCASCNLQDKKINIIEDFVWRKPSSRTCIRHLLTEVS